LAVITGQRDQSITLTTPKQSHVESWPDVRETSNKHDNGAVKVDVSKKKRFDFRLESHSEREDDSFLGKPAIKPADVLAVKPVGPLGNKVSLPG
jgi:hypothetical protein